MGHPGVAELVQGNQVGQSGVAELVQAIPPAHASTSVSIDHVNICTGSASDEDEGKRKEFELKQHVTCNIGIKAAPKRSNIIPA